MSVSTSGMTTIGLNNVNREVLEIPITSEDFQFVGYPNPEKFFNGAQRPYRHIMNLPSIERYFEAIYTPATRHYKPFDGCLYDEDMKKIDGSRIKRGREDRLLDLEPDQFEGPSRDLPVYDRPLLYLGRIFGHYGHFLMESLSYWWPLAEAINEYDRFLIHIHDAKILKKPYIKALLSAAKISEENLVYFNQPTRLKDVVVPVPSFQMYSHIYSEYKAILKRISISLGAEDVKQSDQPVYISRRLLKTGVSKFKGEDEIEAFLEKRGVHIAHPQQLPFPEQVKLYNQHKCIIGVIGSGMHNSVLTIEPKTLVYLTTHRPISTAYLTDKCYNARSTYVMSVKSTDKIRHFTRKARELLIGKQKTDGFRRLNEFDVDRLISWFSTSGLL